jgi:hypothetical protein
VIVVFVDAIGPLWQKLKEELTQYQEAPRRGLGVILMRANEL